MKNVMDVLFGATAFVAGGVNGFGIAVQGESAPPDIILILADDLGYSDLGCYGSEIHTPNLDMLAEDGIRFTQFYNAARCCPSRASILTGLYPHQAGIGAMVDPQREGFPAYQGYLSDHCITLGEALGTVGYRTVMAGKWHVGHREEFMRPHKRGFDRSLSFMGGACNYFDVTWPIGNHPGHIEQDGKPYLVPENFFFTDTITDFVIEVIHETPSEIPIFGYIAHLAPHWPLHERPENIAKYKGRYDAGWDILREERYQQMMSMGLIDERYIPADRGDGETWVPAWKDMTEDKKSDMARRMEVFAAQVDGMDQSIGRLVGALKETGRYENTLIIFLSDNGACAEPNYQAFGKIWVNPEAEIGTRESFASYGRGWAEVGNTPFRLWKSKIHEGGIRTPLIAHWPAGIRVPKNYINRQPGHIVDLMATILDVAGAEYPRQFKGREILPMEGISFAPVFRGASREEHDLLAWEHFANAGMLSGDWKIVAEVTSTPHGRMPGPWELYHIKQDPTEMNNLASVYPEKVQSLNQKYNQWAERVGVVQNLRDLEGLNP